MQVKQKQNKKFFPQRVRVYYRSESETNAETSQTLTNRIHFPHKMALQAFFSCKIKTMHIPRKMNAFLLTCLYSSFTYVQMSLESPLQTSVCICQSYNNVLADCRSLWVLSQMSFHKETIFKNLKQIKTLLGI